MTAILLFWAPIWLPWRHVRTLSTSFPVSSLFLENPGNELYVSDLGILIEMKDCAFFFFSLAARNSSHYRKHEQSWTFHRYLVSLWRTRQERIVYSNSCWCNRFVPIFCTAFLLKKASLWVFYCSLVLFFMESRTLQFAVKKICYGLLPFFTSISKIF